MKQLSSGMTGVNRTFIPVVWGIAAAAYLVGSHGAINWFTILLILMFGGATWYGRRLSDVWLDGDVLQVEGPAGSFRVPLGEVVLFDDQFLRLRMIVLRMEHPVGRVKEVRFMPEGTWVAFGPSPADALEEDLQVRIHAARAARAGRES